MFKKAQELIPYEFNFWIFLLIFLGLSQPRDLNFLEDGVTLFFCFFAFSVIFISLFIKIIENLSFKVKLLIFLGSYFVFLVFFFKILLFLLPFIFYRLSIFICLASLFTFLVVIIWILQEDEEVSFSSFFKNWLPLIIFFFLFLSFCFWANFLNLRGPFLFFLIYNFSFLQEFYNEDFKPMILKSSLIWNFYRFFLPGAFFNEVWIFCFGSEFLMGGMFGVIRLESLSRNSNILMPRSDYQLINPKPRYLWTGGAAALEVAKITEFSPILKQNLPFLLEELFKNDRGHQNLQKFIESLPKTVYDPFFKSPNFLGSNELLQSFFLKLYFKDKLIFPATTFYNFEGIPVLPKSSSYSVNSHEKLLGRYFGKEKPVMTPFLYHFENEGWFFANTDKSSHFIEFDTVNVELNKLLLRDKDPSYWGHNIQNIRGSKLAIFPTQDFWLLDSKTFQLLETIESKSSSLNDEEWALYKDAGTICVICFNDNRITLQEASCRRPLYSEDISTFKTRVSRSSVQSLLVESFKKDDVLLNNDNLIKIRLNSLEKIIPRGPKLIKIK